MVRVFPEAEVTISDLTDNVLLTYRIAEASGIA